jgi:hypothetical protein
LLEPLEHLTLDVGRCMVSTRDAGVHRCRQGLGEDRHNDGWSVDPPREPWMTVPERVRHNILGKTLDDRFDVAAPLRQSFSEHRLRAIVRERPEHRLAFDVREVLGDQVNDEVTELPDVGR